jgi:hydroxymethylpyrimidine pyrophosphatase-like HAD family hydrolase
MRSNTEPSIKKDVTELAIFDIDGPVTSPVSRKIEHPEILDLTLDFITENGHVAYNTGRASVIAHQRIVSPLLTRARARGTDPAAVSRRVSVFAEKGAVTSFWDDAAGRWSHRIDPATVVPAGLRNEVVDLLRDDPEFRTHVFFDGDKETMVSVEMRHEAPERTLAPITPDVFKPVAERFAAEVRRLAGERGYDDLEVDCTTIAVDIQRLGVGKDLGTRLAFDWLGRLGKQVGRVHCFGDSGSDVAMATEAYSIMSRSFADAGKRVVYVNVGTDLTINGGFEVRSFPGMDGRGTVAYLRALLREPGHRPPSAAR